ncbi:diaminopropionate ammonia-lyase [Antarctobacter heliothermus]|uniref:Diaminopropionate ammonia-lyase n=2 Tax=Antarctobacter heliothermus TaxID=74033 RepID=A0A239KZ13_9RHOB|nr:diaminopropionate ammonia-lyase [Antarctobacter heliothermus]
MFPMKAIWPLLASNALILSQQHLIKSKKYSHLCRKNAQKFLSFFSNADGMTDSTQIPTNLDHHLFHPDASRAEALLKDCPVHAPTPMTEIDLLTEEVGISRLWLKDESDRMGLGSFKALGGAFAVARMIADKAGSEDFSSQATKNTAAEMVFITASAGNHGLSVAAGAKVFGAKAVIVLAAAVPESFANRIRAKSADVLRVDGSYDESVEVARQVARDKDWILLADGSWEGYIDRPALVMEGYCVIPEECRAAFAKLDVWPTHVYLQAGVGGLAAALSAHIRLNWAEQPEIIVVEPDAAPCLQRSVEAGRLTRVDGADSNMGRLDCKDASLIAFRALQQDADRFVTITDEEATAAVNTFARYGIATTPSGAAGLAAPTAASPGPDARCLLIVSEGPEGD